MKGAALGMIPFEQRRGIPIHRMSNSSIFRVWKSMVRRCVDLGNPEYKNYGARGIVVCQRWREFINFFADMGHRPAGMSLGRINNDGNYEPGNCRWATPLQQSWNSRKAWRLTLNGETLLLREWARRLGLSKNALKERQEK